MISYSCWFIQVCVFCESLAECSLGFTYVCVAAVDVTCDVIDGSTLVMIFRCFRPSAEVVCGGGRLPAAGPAQARATELHRTDQGGQGRGDVTTGSLPAMRWRHRALPATVPLERASAQWRHGSVHLCKIFMLCSRCTLRTCVCARVYAPLALPCVRLGLVRVT